MLMLMLMFDGIEINMDMVWYGTYGWWLWTAGRYELYGL